MDNFLEFEKPIEELSAKIDELERVSQAQNIDLGNEISKLESQKQKITKDIFSSTFLKCPSPLSTKILIIF